MNRIPRTECPICGYAMDEATGVEPGAGPREGSLSLCLSCGELMVFRADLTQRRMTAAEIAQVRQDQETWALVQRARAVIEGFPKR